MSSPATLLKSARAQARITQAELAKRLGTTQSVIARLESDRGNPRVETLERALEATGHRLEFSIRPRIPEVDETQIREMLRLTPAQRIARFEAAYDNVRKAFSHP